MRKEYAYELTNHEEFEYSKLKRAESELKSTMTPCDFLPLYFRKHWTVMWPTKVMTSCGRCGTLCRKNTDRYNYVLATVKNKEVLTTEIDSKEAWNFLDKTRWELDLKPGDKVTVFGFWSEQPENILEVKEVSPEGEVYCFGTAYVRGIIQETGYTFKYDKNDGRVKGGADCYEGPGGYIAPYLKIHKEPVREHKRKEAEKAKNQQTIKEAKEAIYSIYYRCYLWGCPTLEQAQKILDFAKEIMNG